MEKFSLPGKKILMIRNAYSYDFGGGERMPVDIAAELTLLGFNVLIVSQSKKLLDYASSKNIKSIRGWWWSHQNWSGYRVVFTPVYFIWQLLLMVWYLTLFIKHRPQVIHAQSKDDFIAATLAGRMLGKKIVWSDQADLKYIYHNVFTWNKNPVGKLVWLCGKLASCVILTSQSDKFLIEQAVNRKLPKQYRIVYNGIPDQPELINKQRSGKITVFAATSRLVTAKGIGELIEAFKRLSKEHSDIELWLFGEGPEETKFKKMAEGDDRIFFKGFPRNTLEQVAKADIFVHPSYLEGFSISLIEAAMLAKPIIACRVGGNPEIVTSNVNGFLVPEKDVAALQAAMETLATEKDLRERFGKKSRELYEANFELSRVVKEEYLKIYA